MIEGYGKKWERLQSCALDCEICRTIWLRRTELDRLGNWECIGPEMLR